MTNSQSNNSSSISSKHKRKLRGIAHHLQPVVTVSDKGIADPVISETQRALRDHELIKVRLNLMDKSDRTAVAEQLAGRCAADIVQIIGKVLVLFKANPDVDLKLSNVSRFEVD